MVFIPEPKLYRDTVFAIIDSGAPPNSTDYTTLVLVHGAGSNGGQFHRLLPIATAHNARLVFLNRRDYKGSLRVPGEEVHALAAGAALPDSDSDAAREAASTYMRARIREFFDFLCAFAKEERIPLPVVGDSARTRGGMVVTGWSAGNMLVTGLLAYVAGSKAADGFDLRAYIRRVVLYDGPHRILGYVPSSGSDGHNPLFCTSPCPCGPGAGSHAERARQFGIFASGYYDHGPVPGVFEDRHALAEPCPTVLTIPDEERLLTADPAPMRPGGSELTMISLGKKLGTFTVLKDRMLYLDSEEKEGGDRSWDGLPVHVIWGERSVWEVPKAAWDMQKEVEAGEKAGRRMRKVVFTKVQGGNHFFHRENPEEALKLFLNDP